MRLRNLPTRLITGAYIAHTGWTKWTADEETARGLHGMATGTYPFFAPIQPPQFVKALSITEMTVGAALLAPVVPAGVAGAALVGFAGGLLGMYARTPGMHEPGSIWPTKQGTAISKDSWLLAVGLGLMIGGASDRRSAQKETETA